MEQLFRFFSPDAIERRGRAAADIGRDLEQYIPPNLRPLVGLLVDSNPVMGIDRAGDASARVVAPDRSVMERIGDLGEALSETASVIAPMGAAVKVGRPAAEAMQEGLLGISVPARSAAQAVIDRANQPGPVPTMYSNPVMRADDVSRKPSYDPATPAQEIAGLLSSGRADEVTDEMLAKFTPKDEMEMFDLYQRGATGMDLPMDEASRMARARDAGFEGNLFHGTGADIVDIDKEKFGLGENLLGKGFYTTSNPKRADIYVPVGNPPLPKGVFQSGNNEYTQGGNILPLNTRSDAEFDARQKTGKANALSIGSAFQNSDFDVEIRDSGDQVFIKSKTNPDLSVYIDSYQDGMITLQKLKDTFGRGNVTEILEQAGFSGLKAPESSGSLTKVNYKPEDVRSRFARFDPRLAHLRNLSAGVGGLGLLSAGIPQEEQY